MIGILSKSAGVLFFPHETQDFFTAWDLSDGRELSSEEILYDYFPKEDCEEILADTSENVFDIATSKYWTYRATSYIQIIVEGLEDRFEKDAFEHVEDILQNYANPNDVLDQLLIAPLADPNLPSASIKRSLSLGYTVLASILDELVICQPLLNRFVNKWFALSDELFLPFSNQRGFIWQRVVDNCNFKELLGSDSRSAFLSLWHTLTFSFKTPTCIGGINKIGTELSKAIFPHEENDNSHILQSRYEEERCVSDHFCRKKIRPRHTFKRVQKQIESIVASISEGKDDIGKKFLDELIQEQTSDANSISFAVKSLCNIAQKSADLFRYDFEYLCLNEARRICPSDAWTMIQLGDHLKRTGNFEDALKMLELARKHGHEEIASSGIADIFSQMGKYQKAIDLYESIPNWESKPEILTAIADNHRWLGHYDHAKSSYQKLLLFSQENPIEFSSAGVRAKVGLAEIEKKQGKLQAALDAYKCILSEGNFEERHGLIYRLALCNILKLLGRIEEAYPIADQAVCEFPFFSGARYMRGALLGLIGKAEEGLKDFLELQGNNSLNDWLRYFFRGLLLLKLDAYEQARKNLVEQLPAIMASNEDISIFRMASVVFHLKENHLKDAGMLLKEIPDLIDYNQQYMALVLKLHLAAKEKNKANVEFFSRHINSLNPFSAGISKAVEVIRCGDFDQALSLEIDALLQLAA